jgi:hypothetical protein
LRVIKRGDVNAIDQCEKITVPQQGIVLCELKKGQVFSNSPPVFLSVWFGGRELGCDPQDDCKYTALADGAYPLLNSSSKSDDTTLVLTGSGFTFTSGITPSVIFLGVSADSVTVNSDTQATATFD